MLDRKKARALVQWRPHAPFAAGGLNPCKILGRRGSPRFGDSGRQKIPLFSIADCLALQIFPNLFLAEMWEINELRLKKFGFVVFLDLAASFTAMALWIWAIRMTSILYTTIPYFQKQLAAAQGLRASLAKPAARSTIVWRIESRSVGFDIARGMAPNPGGAAKD